MNSDNSSYIKDIEELVSKTIEVNKLFISEGTRMVKEMSSATGEKKSVNIFQPEMITNAFNAYAKLNIQHLKNVMDLGVALARQTSTQSGATAETVKEEEQATTSTAPAFILNGIAEVGSKAQFNFLIDNDRKEEVTCSFVNSDFENQTNFSQHQVCNTEFSPQSFLLQPGGSQPVVINVNIPSNAVLGNYISNVQVKGFEPAFFSIHLTIEERKAKTSSHDKTKPKAKPKSKPKAGTKAKRKG